MMKKRRRCKILDSRLKMSGASVFQVKPFYDAGAPSAIQGVPRRAIACSRNSSFRITATNATLPDFPRRRNS